MNALRRKQISALDTDRIRKAVAELKDAVENVKLDAEVIRDEEQEYLDNMPEAMQGGEKGEKAAEDIGVLEAFIDALDGLDIDGIADECDTLDQHGF